MLLHALRSAITATAELLVYIYGRGGRYTCTLYIGAYLFFYPVC